LTEVHLIFSSVPVIQNIVVWRALFVGSAPDNGVNGTAPRALAGAIAPLPGVWAMCFVIARSGVARCARLWPEQVQGGDEARKPPPEFRPLP
jgi:hypothetical protein